VTAVVTVGLSACSHSTTAGRPVSASSAAPTAKSSPTAKTPVSTPPAAAHSSSAAQIRAAVSAKVAALAKHEPNGSISVAALNTATGQQFSWGAAAGMWTASVYKLYVLETLLAENGGPLSGSEASQAIPMIEQSDNVAGYALFLDAGGRSGLTSGAQRLGLKHTVPGRSDPTFTTTGAPDLLTLLKNLVRSGPLTRSARSYALNLMRNVEADQRWGVGVDADKGTDFANKNGWLSIDNSNGPGETDNGRWAVNSVGVITVRGQQVLMAVMTRHQPSFADGVDLVQDLARALKPAIS
jgi:beta-lactamase class A